MGDLGCGFAVCGCWVWGFGCCDAVSFTCLFLFIVGFVIRFLGEM